MKKLWLLAAVMLAVLASSAGSARAVVPTATEMSLSSPSALATDTTYSADGYMTTTVTPDTTTALALASDGYLCGNVGYNATQKWYDPVGIVIWTYRQHFSVHVCHNRVGYLVALSDYAVDSNFGWGWCGNIYKWHSSLPYSSARSETEGCFTVFDKFGDTRYPWAKMTIGGNGGLWVRKTGVGGFTP